jgi:SAM-dependent methyltransferase
MHVDYIRFSERAERLNYLVERFGTHLSGSLLDVGCDEAPLKKLLPECTYTGVDIGGSPDIQLNLEESESLPFKDGQFDCVVCTDVLEHLDNLHKVFNELLRVSNRCVIVSLPNNWSTARVPIGRGYGSFKHYGLPADRPVDRHKWFFAYTDARSFIRTHVARRDDLRILEERVCEKPKFPPIRWFRRLLHLKQELYLNRYAHTYWVVLELGS